ncbi:hypothetical protein AAFF_G00284960 [Aldrovandia affinis]|uniref:Circadian-associated transcriptional repressor n=1 Tax=Aldrovandia affinis TaxID=143900 RepID=A0AAD7X2Q5_9TELE|nr:hypothetical protein AAFF_G00284960 [Aldrovandia affinis]
MSASDSDCSIDWLASDDEDSDSVSELECGGGAGAGETPPLPALSQPGGSDCVDGAEEGGGRQGGGSRVEPRGGRVYGSPLQVRSASPWRSPTYAVDGLSSEGPWQAPKRPRSPGGWRHWPWQHPEKTANDELFARKCMELQCYVPHLSSILSGLQSGRYRERLSSFQESVAMDRIQRIMGVLQNPCMGERYINIILKVEEMLRSWFPNVTPKGQHAGDQTEETTPSKRLKPCSATAAESPMALSGPAPGNKALGASEPTPLGAYSANHLKWLHTSPVCPPSAELALGRLRRWPAAAPGDKDVTQDNAVSSSTDPPPGGQRPPPGKINAPCLERLLKSTESIITRKGAGDAKESSWS